MLTGSFYAKFIVDADDLEFRMWDLMMYGIFTKLVLRDIKKRENGKKIATGVDLKDFERKVDYEAGCV